MKQGILPEDAVRGLKLYFRRALTPEQQKRPVRWADIPIDVLLNNGYLPNLTGNLHTLGVWLDDLYNPKRCIVAFSSCC